MSQENFNHDNDLNLLHIKSRSATSDEFSFEKTTVLLLSFCSAPYENAFKIFEPNANVLQNTDITLPFC